MTRLVARISDVMGGRDKAEIVCRYGRGVVRTLAKVREGQRLLSGTIRMTCPNGESVDVPWDTPLAYEPWFMDRGNILFNGNIKLCTEADLVRFSDGTEESIQPDPSIVPVPEPVDEDAEPEQDDSPKGNEMVCSFDDDSVVPNPR